MMYITVGGKFVQADLFLKDLGWGWSLDRIGISKGRLNLHKASI